MGQLLVSGEGAAAALEAILPAHVSALKPGRVRYSLLLDDNGGILDDLMVTNITTDGGEPTYYLVVNGATKWDDIAHLREHLPDEVTLTHLDEQALIALQGPSAATALNRVMRGVPDSLTFMQSMPFDFGDLPLRVSRCGYTGEDGFEISVASSQAQVLADRICAELEVRPAGLGARDSLRLEAGLPLYGHDLDPTRDPVSAELSFALTKKRREDGGWMGHGACAVKFVNGVAERRVGLVLDGRLPAREGAKVYSGDTEIGQVTSGGFSPTLGHPVAMAYMAVDHSTEGTFVEVEVRGKRLPATVSPLPFVPHRYFRGS
jgi:aminomethyltransferase